ncbi:hypothetical protein NPX13_g9904 [Xylaria arbuscula]|uniref:GP-PDE domain-containing protein n=1 Tax=Xylaria arbuscula TaxID=114810 RepID=A0A9W8THZ5_9PEZI|nr:hypothetical protein NPX13_g9904 [Xylaria arbuscula]
MTASYHTPKTPTVWHGLLAMRREAGLPETLLPLSYLDTRSDSLPNLNEIRGKPQAILEEIEKWSERNQILMTIGPERGRVLKLLRLELERVDAFLKEKTLALQRSLDQVVERATRAPANSPTLVAIRQSLLELFDVIEDLDSFAKTNRDIASRIYCKSRVNIEKLKTWPDSMSTPTLQSRPWLKNVFICNQVLKAICERLPTSRVVDPRTSLLETVSSLDPNGTFQARDERGRLPLHYAAAYGFQHYCVRIFEHTKQYEDCVSPDNFGDTPLALAIAAGHTEVVELLISKLRAFPDGLVMPKGLLGRMLLLSIQTDQTDVSKSLIEIGQELDLPGKGNLTPLYLAAQRHQLEVVKLLLRSSVNINVKSSGRSWTPLIVATVYGHLDVVKELVEAGADTTSANHRGWTAAHHAAYRGHLKIVQELHNASHGPKETIINQFMTQEVQSLASVTPPIITTMCSTEKGGAALLGTDFSHIFVNIGSFDLYKTTEHIDLEPYTNVLLPERLPKSCMALEVSASGCEEKYCVQLPILEDLSNSPWEFSTRTPETARLTFKIYETHRPQNTAHTGIAILSELASRLGPYRATVGQHYSIPLVGQMGAYTGTLNFTFIVSRPVMFPPPMIQKQEMYSSGTTSVGAHRGLGQNNTKHENVQIGENTMQVCPTSDFLRLFHVIIDDCAVIQISNKTRSFFCGDVQVTKDFVPVVYHDFLVSETGTDATLHTLLYAQFMALSQAQTTVWEEEELRAARFSWDERDRPRLTQRRRSRSLSASQDHRANALLERMQHTFEYSTYGSKPNIRGSHIHEPFVTLRQLLEQLPESVNFGIELKYPMLFETDDWKMDPYAMEHNKFVDTILDVLFRHGRGRHIFLSSFSPELCILLATKQRVYPVLFLNDSSNWPTGDPRALSVQSAVHFARKWGLGGIIMASEPFVSCPELVKYVKDQHLFCASYGAQNDDPDCVKTQADAGIDAVIVNKVHLIAKTLITGE